MSAADTQPVNWGRYARWYGGALLGFMLLVGGTNFVVDPFGRFRTIDVEGFNRVKVGVKRDTRKGKTATLWECRFDTILLGSSRIEFGLNPKNPAFPERTYNAGLKSTSIYEMQRLARYMLEHQAPRMVVVGLDFFAFNERRIGADDFEESLIGHGQQPWSVFKYLVSLETLQSAAITVLWNRLDVFDPCEQNGYDRGYPLRSSTADEFRRTVESFLDNPNYYQDYLAGDDYPRRLMQMLLELRSSGSDVRVFLSPVHAALIEAMAVAGLDDDYFRWKRRMVELVAEVNAAQPDARPMELWDFSGYNSVNTEVVAADGSRLRNFRDPSHYRDKVGNFVIEKVLGQPPGEAPVPADFGVVLTPANVDARLASEQQAAAATSLGDFGVEF